MVYKAYSFVVSHSPSSHFCATEEEEKRSSALLKVML